MSISLHRHTLTIKAPGRTETVIKLKSIIGYSYVEDLNTVTFYIKGLSRTLSVECNESAIEYTKKILSKISHIFEEEQ